MVDILHRVGMVAPRDEVHRAIATPDGIASWWTIDTTGSGEVGGELVVRFGEVGGFDIRVLESEPGLVRWLVTDGPQEWISTEIVWRLDQRGDWTIVLFSHEGWREPVEFMHHCSTKWATFLLSLKDTVEAGKGRPAPDDVKVSDWH